MLSRKALFYKGSYCYQNHHKKITNNITLPLKNITMLDSTKTQPIVKVKLAPIHKAQCYLFFSHAKTKGLVFRGALCYTSYIR